MVRPLLSNVSYELTVKLWQRLNVNKEIIPFYLIKCDSQETEKISFFFL